MAARWIGTSGSAPERWTATTAYNPPVDGQRGEARCRGDRPELLNITTLNNTAAATTVGGPAATLKQGIANRAASGAAVTVSAGTPDLGGIIGDHRFAAGGVGRYGLAGGRDTYDRRQQHRTNFGVIAGTGGGLIKTGTGNGTFTPGEINTRTPERPRFQEARWIAAATQCLGGGAVVLNTGGTFDIAATTPTVATFTPAVAHWQERGR